MDSTTAQLPSSMSGLPLRSFVDGAHVQVAIDYPPGNVKSLHTSDWRKVKSAVKLKGS